MTTLAGALIVFFGYVAKEHFREEYKDELDSFNSLQSYFSIRQQLTDEQRVTMSRLEGILSPVF